MIRQNFLIYLLLVVVLNSCNEKPTNKDSKTETEEELVERALAIHKKVLTLDTHADTPMRMIEPGFDMAERHDPNETGAQIVALEGCKAIALTHTHVGPDGFLFCCNSRFSGPIHLRLA